MSRLIRVELLKITTARLTYGLLATAGGLTALLTWLRSARAGHGATLPLFTAGGQSTAFTVIGFALLIAAIFGATVSSGEFRHSTATGTYLAAPRRTRVMLAKIAAAGLVGLVFGAVGAIADIGVTLLYLGAGGTAIALSAGTIAGYALGTVLAAGLLAAIGAALGTLLRSQLAAVIGTFLWGFFVEAILGGVYSWMAPYLPFTAATTLAGSKLGGAGFGFPTDDTTPPLPFIAAVLLVVGVGALIALVARQTTLRRDIA
jgi:ABC-type transport system involved in multi-copper enzyme maturation permease subunit